MPFNIRTLKIHQLFLIDGIGALLSAFLLCIVKYHKDIFGISDTMFYQLIPLPVVFACYSLTSSLVKPGKWKIFLAIIAVCNVLYIAYSLLLMYRNAHQLTLAGLAYFKIELLVILILVCLEIDYIKHAKNTV